ncbi:MAG: hypothetical protein R3A11_03960 [Bdellovibrionota bacterium]
MTTSGVLAILVIQAIIAAIAVPKAIDYFRAQKTKEAYHNLQQIFDLEVLHFTKMKAHPPLDGQVSFLALPHHPDVPKAQPQSIQFNKGAWTELGFVPDGPVLYSYSVETQGSNLLAEFTVRAQGDLDGDGKFSLFEITGRVNSEGRVEGRDTVFALDPLE